MTKRKADMVLVAEALGLPLVVGETTGALAKRCADRAAELVELATAIPGEEDEGVRYQEPTQAEREQDREESPPPKGNHRLPGAMERGEVVRSARPRKAKRSRQGKGSRGRA